VSAQGEWYISAGLIAQCYVDGYDLLRDTSEGDGGRDMNRLLVGVALFFCIIRRLCIP
jgi:hypothetical protein